MFVYTRWDNGVSMVRLSLAREIAHWTFANQEPIEVTTGRPFLYDLSLIHI